MPARSPSGIMGDGTTTGLCGFKRGRDIPAFSIDLWGIFLIPTWLVSLVMEKPRPKVRAGGASQPWLLSCCSRSASRSAISDTLVFDLLSLFIRSGVAAGHTAGVVAIWLWGVNSTYRCVHKVASSVI